MPISDQQTDVRAKCIKSANYFFRFFSWQRFQIVSDVLLNLHCFQPHEKFRKFIIQNFRQNLAYPITVVCSSNVLRVRVVYGGGEQNIIDIVVGKEQGVQRYRKYNSCLAGALKYFLVVLFSG